MTDVGPDPPSLNLTENYIASYIINNFFIANYHSTWPIDHDDGSCYYTDAYNFLVYGGYKNYLGHSKTATNNIYVYPDAVHSYGNDVGELGKFLTKPWCQNSDGAALTDLPSGWGEVWTNNTCVITSSQIYNNDRCDPTRVRLKDLVPFTANNHFYAVNSTISSYSCDKNATFTLKEYQDL